MSAPNPTRDEKIEAIRLHFVGTLPGIWEELERNCRRSVEGPLQRDHGARAKYQAHMLAGTAGTFGFTDVAAAARMLEGLLGSALEAREAPEAGSMRLELAALKGAVEQVLAPGQVAKKGSP